MNPGNPAPEFLQFYSMVPLVNGKRQTAESKQKTKSFGSNKRGRISLDRKRKRSREREHKCL